MDEIFGTVVKKSHSTSNCRNMAPYIVRDAIEGNRKAQATALLIGLSQYLKRQLIEDVEI